GESGVGAVDPGGGSEHGDFCGQSRVGRDQGVCPARRGVGGPGVGLFADPSDTTEFLADYRAHWLVARTAEHIGGWSRRPLPLPDMCYAAAATGDPHLRDMIVKALVSVEEDLQYEAPR
ncbi:MAG: hypothetical protein U1D00_01580, partial [Mycobacterium sp.]|nr:hypothetical protein [Mycobacterium sp.]